MLSTEGAAKTFVNWWPCWRHIDLTCAAHRKVCRFKFDEATVRAGLNFTLRTTLGDLDLLGEVAGGGTFEQLRPFTEPVKLFGLDLTAVTLEKLIQLKRAAGRPKDLEPIAELQALLEERRQRNQ